MIRDFHFADWFTLANAVCGTGAVLTSMTYLQTGDVSRLYVASAAILAALVFDVLDGRIARWRQTSSALGRELDSLADVISFGVAPAVLAYACGMQGFLDRVVLAYFVACGVSRLARYNVTAEALSGGTGKVAYFEGTPIPTSIVLVGMLARRGLSRRDRRAVMVRRDRARRFQAALARAGVRRVGLADDQPHPHPEALK